MFESIEIPLLLISIVAGALIGIPTGPANFFIVDTCMKEGRLEALQVYAGLVIAKILYAGLALVANELIISHPKIEPIVYLLASLLLVGWGVLIIIKSKDKTGSAIELNIKSLFKKGFVLGISNPAIPFVYLAFVQLLKAYSADITLWGYAFYLILFEIATFLTIASVSLLLLVKKGKVLEHWPKVKLTMGVLIISIGAYHIYQHVEIKDGIHLKKNKSSLKKNIDKLELGE